MNRSGLLSKRIPTIFGLLILVAGLIAGIYLVGNKQILSSKAGPTSVPRNVKITNVMSNSLSISWTTDVPVTGYVKYSEDPKKVTTPAGDARDQISGTSQSYKNHYVNVNNLKANTTYYFAIVTGPQTYNDSGKPFQVKTGPQVASKAEDIISGKVVSEGGTAVNGALVYFETDQGGALSTTTKSDGTWRLDLSTARNEDGQTIEYDASASLLLIFVQSESSGTATAIAEIAKAKPVPDIVLGKNQSFVEELAELGIEEQTQIATEGFGALASLPAPAVEMSASGSSEVVIINPVVEGEMLGTQTPEFLGTGKPGTTLTITVHSDTEQTGVVEVNTDGTWNWTPPNDLEVGEHTITVSYVNQNGDTQEVTKTFMVLAAGDVAGLPAFTATPSATPTGYIGYDISPTPTSSSSQVMMPDSGTKITEVGMDTQTYLLAGGGFLLLLGGWKLKKKFSDE